jgi:Leucine-rich repeat (LRR) protein
LYDVVEVDFYATDVTDSDLQLITIFSECKTLNLTNTQITDAGLEHLEGLKQLQNLYLAKTQVTDAGVAKLQKALPNCKISH